MNVAIIGCGLIGRKRAIVLDREDTLVACCDTNFILAKEFAQEFSCKPFNNHQELFKNTNCDIVIVAVVNKFLKEIVVYALQQHKHVIAEKPLGINLKESEEIIELLEKINSSKNIQLKTGFNLRFHPGIFKAKQIIDNGTIGKLLNIRIRYGHGGRVGMEKEWRASKDLCGGGELLDQGVHAIDLIRWFAGEINDVYAQLETKFWPLEVEDNGFGILNTHNGITCVVHVSWTNWKNIFSLEVFGELGYVKVEGLGGSYGQEVLEIGKRKKEGGLPEIEIIEYPQEDVSWRNEWLEFKNAIKEKRSCIGNGYDGLKANEVIEAMYQSHSQQKKIFLIN